MDTTTSKPNLHLIANLLNQAKTIDEATDYKKPLKEYITQFLKNELPDMIDTEYITRAFALYARSFVKKPFLFEQTIAEHADSPQELVDIVQSYYYFLVGKYPAKNRLDYLVTFAAQNPNRVGNEIVRLIESKHAFMHQVRESGYAKLFRILEEMSQTHAHSEHETLRLIGIAFAEGIVLETSFSINGKKGSEAWYVVGSHISELINYEITFLNHNWGSRHHFVRSILSSKIAGVLDKKLFLVDRLSNLLFTQWKDKAPKEKITALVFQFTVVMGLQNQPNFLKVSQAVTDLMSKQDTFNVREFHEAARAMIQKSIE